MKKVMTLLFLAGVVFLFSACTKQKTEKAGVETNPFVLETYYEMRDRIDEIRNNGKDLATEVQKLSKFWERNRCPVSSWFPEEKKLYEQQREKVDNLIFAYDTKVREYNNIMSEKESAKFLTQKETLPKDLVPLPKKIKGYDIYEELWDKLPRDRGGPFEP